MEIKTEKEDHLAVTTERKMPEGCAELKVIKTESRDYTARDCMLVKAE